MAFLEAPSVELVPLDPDRDAHVLAYARSRTDSRMRETGAYGGTLTREMARDEIDAGALEKRHGESWQGNIITLSPVRRVAAGAAEHGPAGDESDDQNRGSQRGRSRAREEKRD